MVTNEEIYDLLMKLSQKIDNLESKLQYVQKTEAAMPEPSLSIEEWLDEASVEQSYINILVSTSDGIMAAFKLFVSNNNNKLQLPLFTYKRKTYVTVTKDDLKKWQPLDQASEYFVREIWRKFVKYTLDNPFQGVHPDIVDIYKQRIMAMRKNLYEVEKNKKEILKWLANTG